MWGANAVGVHLFADFEHLSFDDAHLLFNFFFTGLGLTAHVVPLVAHLEVDGGQFVEVILGGILSLNFFVHIFLLGWGYSITTLDSVKRFLQKFLFGIGR